MKSTWCYYYQTQCNCSQNILLCKSTTDSFVVSLFPGHRSGQADRGCGLHRVHLQVLWEQCPGRVPRHHAGVRGARPSACVTAQTQRLTAGPQAGIPAASTDWDPGANPRHQKGSSQELYAHVGTDCTNWPRRCTKRTCIWHAEFYL